MQEPSTTTEMWIERVSAWRASGERAETFSARAGYAASTLRWWASKLKQELAALPATATRKVRLARVVRTPSPDVVSAARGQAITIDVVHAGVRIGIEVGADRATLASTSTPSRYQVSSRRTAKL